MGRGSPMQSSIPGPWDPGPSWRQALSRLNHPGVPRSKQLWLFLLLLWAFPSFTCLPWPSGLWCSPDLRSRQLAQGHWYPLTLASGRCGLVSLGFGHWPWSTQHPLLTPEAFLWPHSPLCTCTYYGPLVPTQLLAMSLDFLEQHNYRMLSCSAQGQRRLRAISGPLIALNLRF